MHPSTKKSVVNRNEIREVTLKYCIDTLTNNIPDEAFKKEIEEKKEKVKEIMKEEGGEFETNWETFYWNIQKFKKSGKKNYDFLTKSGLKFQRAVFKMCQRMLREEIFPESFKETTLHMLFKGKGRKDHLPNQRFVHCKE